MRSCFTDGTLVRSLSSTDDCGRCAGDGRSVGSYTKAFCPVPMMSFRQVALECLYVALFQAPEATTRDIPFCPNRPLLAGNRSVQRRPSPLIWTTLSGSTSIFQNAEGGDCRTCSKAARITEAWVIAIVCPLSPSCRSSQAATRLDSVASDSPPCGAAVRSAIQAATFSGSVACSSVMDLPLQRP
jgi:hypothetical protein